MQSHEHYHPTEDFQDAMDDADEALDEALDNWYEGTGTEDEWNLILIACGKSEKIKGQR